MISISRLEPLGFYFIFLDFVFTLTNKFEIIGFGELRDGIYSINLQNNATYNFVHVSTG